MNLFKICKDAFKKKPQPKMKPISLSTPKILKLPDTPKAPRSNSKFFQKQ